MHIVACDRALVDLDCGGGTRDVTVDDLGINSIPVDVLDTDQEPVATGPEISTFWMIVPADLLMETPKASPPTVMRTFLMVTLSPVTSTPYPVV